MSSKASQMLRSEEQQEVAWRRVNAPRAAGRCRRRIRRIRGLSGRWLARGVQTEILGGKRKEKKKERQPEAVIKHNNVPHKSTKSGEVLKDTYQFPISAIMLSSHTVLARGNCSSPL